MASRFGVLHGSAILLVVYVFINAFLIGAQVSPDFQLFALPWSYVTQFTAMIVGFLAALGLVEFAYWSANEKGIGKFNLAAVVGLVMGIAGSILFVIVLLTKYELNDPVLNRYVGDYLFMGSFVILITWRNLLVQFGQFIKLTK